MVEDGEGFSRKEKVWGFREIDGRLRSEVRRKKEKNMKMCSNLYKGVILEANFGVSEDFAVAAAISHCCAKVLG
ncbi:Protein unc-80-like protein [Bienertia sinuspersici]